MKNTLAPLSIVFIGLLACGRGGSSKVSQNIVVSESEKKLSPQGEAPLLPNDGKFEVEDLKSVDFEKGKREIKVTISSDSKEYVEMHKLIQPPSEHFDLISFFDPDPIKDLHTFQIRQFAIYPEKQYRAVVDGEERSYVAFSARVFYKHKSGVMSNWANAFFIRPSGTTAIYGIIGQRPGGVCSLDNSVKCSKDELYIYWATIGDLFGYGKLRDVLKTALPALATKYSAEIRKIL